MEYYCTVFTNKAKSKQKKRFPLWDEGQWDMGVQYWHKYGRCTNP